MFSYFYIIIGFLHRNKKEIHLFLVDRDIKFLTYSPKNKILVTKLFKKKKTL